ncbi:MAG: N-acyl homoserine lactonase family protein [Rhodospirillales bacterium]|nr:N-acyl homoserine lactonase family protein [Rhodospirillales bacterium]
MSDTEIYEVYAIKYARHERTAELNFMDPPDIHGGSMPIDYFVWVARSANRTFVIDTGFSAETAARRGREIIRCPAQSLSLVGIDASAVQDVIISHLHYDHVGNFDLFPACTFHLQDAEMAYATGRFMRHRHFRTPFDVDHVTGMVREVYKGRVQFHDGDAELAPGFSLHRIGGHTAGLQAVRVHTQRGWVVLASDASHLYANMQRENPYPIIFKVDEMLEGYNKLRELADSEDHIIPGHDPLVMDYYPAPAADVEGIVVRLDVAPSKG